MILYFTLIFIGSVVANGLFGKAVTIVLVEVDVEKRRNPQRRRTEKDREDFIVVCRKDKKKDEREEGDIREA